MTVLSSMAVGSFIIEKSAIFIYCAKYLHLRVCILLLTFSGSSLVISVLPELQDPLGAHVAGGQGQKCHVSAGWGGCNRRSLTCKRQHSAESQLPTIYFQSLNNTSQPKNHQVFAQSCRCQVKPFMGREHARCSHEFCSSTRMAR